MFSCSEDLKTPVAISRLQTAVYVMCGGGFLGRMAARQPADFYIDDRVGRLPYGRRKIHKAVKTLAKLAESADLDPAHLPDDFDFHNCGVW